MWPVGDLPRHHHPLSGEGRGMKAELPRGNTFIQDSRFVEAINYYELSSRGPSRLSVLKAKVVTGALHDSGERFDAPKCHPNTRTAVLREIKKWLKGAHDGRGKKILWLYGPAGAGKSAIAQTVADMLYKEGLLAGAFFFSRTADRRNIKVYLISTLCYQLLRAFPDMRPYVNQAIDDDPFIFAKTLSGQMEELIIKPILAAYPSHSERPLVIIIDGLDECSGEPEQQEILSVFEAHLRQAEIPLILLVASRPERAIRSMFGREGFEKLTQRLKLDDSFNPNADISLVLHSSFDEIKRSHFIYDKEWPGEDAIRAIIRKSSGQFIYASAVLKFVGAPKCDPCERLDIILGLAPPSGNTPYPQLDALYHHILSSVSEGSIEVAFDVFAYLLISPRDIWETMSSCIPQGNIRAIEQVLFMDFQRINRHLLDLHSILSIPLVPLGISTSSESIKFYHASFADFLTDTSRSGRFHLDQRAASARISRCFFKRVLAGMVCPDAEKDWLYRPRLREETFRHLLNASPDPALERLLEAMLKPKPNRFDELLKFNAPNIATGQARMTLFELLDDCNYQMEVLRYLKRCHSHFRTTPLCRLTADSRLIPYFLHILRGLTSCKSHICTKHRDPDR